jgi:sortase A
MPPVTAKSLWRLASWRPQLRRPQRLRLPRFSWLEEAPPRPKRATPPTVVYASTALCVVAALALSFVAEVTFLGDLTHNRDQITRLDALRADLANATAPVGPLDDQGRELAPGRPVGILEIPALGIREVVGEGTSAAVTMTGPGHRRDSVLPGQAGVSVLFGRSSAFGAPFANIASLAPGTPIVAETGQGRSEYRVTAVRRAGDPLPQPLPAGASRLLLITADGPRFQPTGVVMVDATAVTKSFDTGPQLRPSQLEPSERLMAGDTSDTNLFPLVLWCQLLLALSVALVWTALRWGRWQTWFVGVPAVLAVGLAVVDHLCQTLPNLL